MSSLFLCIFFFNDTATTEIYTLSLHDALPIFPSWLPCWSDWSSYYHFNYSGYRWRLLRDGRRWRSPSFSDRKSGSAGMPRPISYAVFCLKKKNKKVEQNDLYEQYKAPLFLCTQIQPSRANDHHTMI